MLGRLNLRVDDYPGTKPKEFYRHNSANFFLFHDLIREFFPSYVLGIIPRYLGEQDIRVLRACMKQGLVPAVHGIDHDESRQDEFDGLTTDQVIGRLGPTKGVLEHMLQCRIEDYIPPHNAFGENLTGALCYLKFKNIYGGPGTNEDVPLHGLEMRYSKWPTEYGRSDELLDRDDSVFCIGQKLAAGRDVWLTLHWTWEWNIGLESLRSYMYMLSRHCCIMDIDG